MADYSNIIRREGLSQLYSPDELLVKFNEYVEYMRFGSGVIWTSQLLRTKEGAQLYQVPKLAPLTTKGFCLFARMSHPTFLNYKTEGSPTYKEYNQVAEFITDACDVDVFNGAAVGVYNGNLAASIIRKSFGLVEEEEARDATRVDAIRHELVFTDYTDVTQEALPPSMNDNPELPPIPTFEETGYDNRPNYSSRQDDMAAYKERNGIQQEDD